MSIAIEGVTVVELEPHADARGSLVEFYRESWSVPGRHALQGNISRSNAGAMRGMHLHREQCDYWFPVSGTMFVALADLRSGSPTERATATLQMSAASPKALFIPPGVAHGFLAESDLVLVYLVDRYFDGTDEWGIAWNDPALGIDWPIDEPLLSDRDMRNPSLREALREPIPYAPVVG
jgi:dTDP-4-dehydrorhamnose 3,5-epimerase